MFYRSDEPKSSDQEHCTNLRKQRRGEAPPGKSIVRNGMQGYDAEKKPDATPAGVVWRIVQVAAINM